MRKQLTILLAASVGAVAAASTEATAAKEPKLILAITIDGLRGDIPFRYAERFGPGGFRYLMEQGVVYDNAHYQHSTTFTAVGHATLFTGATARSTASPATTGTTPAAAARSTASRTIGTRSSARSKAHEGTSPRNLTASTYGDELILASGGRARVFSVSIKDRGAILPGGRLGKAFWFSSSSGEFVTSTYYTTTTRPGWPPGTRRSMPTVTWTRPGSSGRQGRLHLRRGRRSGGGEATSTWGGPPRTSSARRRPRTSTARSVTPRWATS